MATMQGELSETHYYTDFVTAGQDAIALVPFLAPFMWGKQTHSSELTGFCVSCAKVHNTSRRRCRYRSTLLNVY
jgi:hypothetical protein